MDSPEAAIAALRANSEASAKQLSSLEHTVTSGFSTMRAEMATKEGQNYQSQLITSLERSLTAEVNTRRENDAELRTEMRSRDEAMKAELARRDNATNARLTDKIKEDEKKEDDRVAEQDRRRWQFYTSVALSILAPLISAAVAAWIVSGGGV